LDSVTLSTKKFYHNSHEGGDEPPSFLSTKPLKMNEYFQTREGSDLNNLSPKLISYLDGRKLKSGEVVKYRLLNKVRNTDPARKKGDDYHYSSAIVIHLRDRIKKPEGGVVEIGVIDSVDPITKIPIFKKPLTILPQKGSGEYFFLNESKLDDVEMYPLLELSNKNASNPFRDANTVAVFERVDEVKESRVRSKKRNFLYDSLDAIRNWTPEEMRIAAAGFNLPSDLEPDTLKDRLEELAEKDPETFYKAIDSQENKIAAIINLAKSKNIIGYSAFENKWFYVGTNDTIILLERREGTDETKQFVNFLMNTPKGADVQEHLKKLIKNP
jgi:hypothetical protein